MTSDNKTDYFRLPLIDFLHLVYDLNTYRCSRDILNIHVERQRPCSATQRYIALAQRSTAQRGWKLLYLSIFVLEIAFVGYIAVL